MGLRFRDMDLGLGALGFQGLSSVETFGRFRRAYNLLVSLLRMQLQAF